MSRSTCLENRSDDTNCEACRQAVVADYGAETQARRYEEFYRELPSRN